MNEDLKLARRRGRKLGLLGALMGLVTGYLMYTGMLVVAMDTWGHAIGWIFHVRFSTEIILGAVSALPIGWYAGDRATLMILAGQKNYRIVGIASAFITVWVASLIGSIPGFLFYAVDHGLTSAFDYLLQPALALSTVGSIPIIIIGSRIGKKIRNSFTSGPK